MKKLTFTIAIAITLSIFGLTTLQTATKIEAASVEAASVEAGTFFFGDNCKNVKFSAKNQHAQNGQIEIRKVTYFNKANGKWQTEDLPNLVVNQGSTFTTGGDDLSDSEGEQITKVKFIYRWKSDGRNANWSGDVTSKEFVPSATVCNANRTYGNSSWIIGN
jgi:hypothetical protein